MTLPRFFAAALLSAVALFASPQQSDIPKSFSVPTADYDYIKREVMVPCATA